MYRSCERERACVCVCLYKPVCVCLYACVCVHTCVRGLTLLLLHGGEQRLRVVPDGARQVLHQGRQLALLLALGLLRVCNGRIRDDPEAGVGLRERQWRAIQEVKEQNKKERVRRFGDMFREKIKKMDVIQV